MGSETVDADNGVPAATYDANRREMNIPVVVTWEPQEGTGKITSIQIRYGVIEAERKAIEEMRNSDPYRDEADPTEYRMVTMQTNKAVDAKLGRCEFVAAIPGIDVNDTVTFYAIVEGDGPTFSEVKKASELKTLQPAKLMQVQKNDEQLNAEVKIELPKTGDASNMLMFAFLLTISAMALCVLSLRRREE